MSTAASSRARVPLFSRPKDLAMFIYFISHIPTSFLIDMVPIYPAVIYPYIQPLLRLNEYYVENFRDPFMGDKTQVWYHTFLYMELVFQLPIFFYSAWALYNNRRSAYLWICVYSAHVVTTVVPIVTSLHLCKPHQFPFTISDEQKQILTSLYMPWVLFPLWMLYESFNQVRRGEQSALKKKRK
ncbi:Transmembrane protein 97 [Lunasporangiospora selenospora]|uniref:Efficient mitochondria targeting-associated protein 19 n=1 Tax=Lunasporangiospora selenospora TaxID=979761 RepID=A0A9P6KF13_9FUNG|nr:Transmembrane protein 97 [Lunasporangiospora selenospora]